ncbi:uncharacterized protein [Blastocystis hominis]|uniref:OB domain-containing protein n=1 Tax=Blastocystis hominis TaxID=12968 RepID=D8LX98_BLAHO|nr:uncharacterized protein [Blastocystis hominis]CBK20893.2 unnamed protein product [Blastocystis hominis]|eukprot:XP_012894941.1 uncharacterized protein [Blastocystis hominis]
MYGGGAYNPNPTSYTGTGGPISPSHPAASRPIIPIVVSMIGRLISHSEGNFQYFDSSISTISVCGIICNIKQGSSERKSFTIHDGTGAIQATFYVQNDNQQFATDGYVRVIGTLRQFQDKVEISGYHCDPISSFNEITIHYLSCIQSYLYFKKRSNPALTSTSNAMNTSDSDDLETKILKYIRMNQQQNGSSTSQFDLMQRFESEGYDRSAVEWELCMESSVDLH